LSILVSIPSRARALRVEMKNWYHSKPDMNYQWEVQTRMLVDNMQHLHIILTLNLAPLRSAIGMME